MANICARSSPRKPLKAIQPSTTAERAKHQRPIKKRHPMTVLSSASSLSSSPWPTTTADVMMVPKTTTVFPHHSPLRLRQRRPPTPNKVTPPSTPTQEPMSVVTDIDSCPLLPLLPSRPPMDDHQHPHNDRHVRFATTAQVMLVRKRSDAEKRQAWYSAADYQKFDEDRRRTLRHYGQQRQIEMMQQQDADEEDTTTCMEEDTTAATSDRETEEEKEDMTLAGLEGHLCREVALHRKRATRYHCYNVLRQQYYNRYWYNMAYGDQAMESLRQTSLYYSSSNAAAARSATPPPPAYYDSGYYYHHYPQQPPPHHHRRYQHHHEQEGYVQAMMQRSILKML